MATRSASWTAAENGELIEGFIRMLAAQLRGDSINKAEVEREIAANLPKRSVKSVTWKLRNVSAVMVDLGYLALDGYVPARNWQQRLEEDVLERIGVDHTLEELMQEMLVSDPRHGLLPTSHLEIEEQAPRPTQRESKSLWGESASRPRHVDWAELEGLRRDLGAAGEALVLRFEIERLIQSGKNSLAANVEHISRTKGDGAGFDILSFEDSGKERFIEVKTTIGGRYTPFLVSRKEVETSKDRQDSYQLYRLHSFRREPRLFRLPGSMTATCDLDPQSFRATLL